MPATLLAAARVQEVSVGRRRSLCVRGNSEVSDAITEVADAPRRRRVRRRDRTTAKRPEPIDLEKELEQSLLEEEARWKGPSDTEIYGEVSHPVKEGKQRFYLQKPHPLLEALFESVVFRTIRSNAGCNNILTTVFDESFPSSKATVDYIEFRVLEIDGKGVSSILQFFLDFGYQEKESFVLKDKQKPIHCRVLRPPLRRHLPKIVLSCLKVDIDLNKDCQTLIRKRMGDWPNRVEKYGPTALGIVGAPWDFPTQSEYAIIGEESTFAAWCLVHGYTPATITMSANAMRHSMHKFSANPDLLSLEHIAQALAEGYPMNPVSEKPIWASENGLVRAVAPVAGVIRMRLSDGNDIGVPGSNVAFIERAVLPEFESLKDENDFTGYEEEHLNHVIDEELVSYMHGCIDTALLVETQLEELHDKVLQKAQNEGRVLTLDGSNEDDEELYKQYFQEVFDESVKAVKEEDTDQDANQQDETV